MNGLRHCNLYVETPGAAKAATGSWQPGSIRMHDQGISADQQEQARFYVSSFLSGSAGFFANWLKKEFKGVSPVRVFCVMSE